MSYDMEQSENSFHFLLSYMSRSYFSTMMDLVSDFDIHPGQIALLLAVSNCHIGNNAGKNQKEIADELLIKPPTVTVMLKRMEASGLVFKQDDPTDQRKTKIFITQKGIETANMLTTAIEKAETITFKGFTQEEIMLMKRFMKQIQHNLFETETSHGNHFEGFISSHNNSEKNQMCRKEKTANDKID